MHLAAKAVPIMRLYARAAQAEVDKGMNISCAMRLR